MNRFRMVAALLLALALSLRTLGAQEAEDRTLLNWAQMRAIINEASGERAQHHILELVPYQRVRPLSEYSQGPFRESEVMVRFAKEYGFSSAEVERFPTPQPLWQPTKGDSGLPTGSDRASSSTSSTHRSRSAATRRPAT